MDERRGRVVFRAASFDYIIPHPGIEYVTS